MPVLDTQNCLACGAPLTAPVQGGKIKCPFCGAVNILKAHDKVKGDEIICPECGAANPKDAKHCGRCGIKLEFNCPKCGTLNSYGTTYCVQCGVDIPAEIKRQQEEALRQQNEELRRQEEARQRLEDEQKKQKIKKRVSFVVTGVLFILAALCIAGFIGYKILDAKSRLLYQDNFGSLGVGGIPARYGGRIIRNGLKKRSKSEDVVG